MSCDGEPAPDRVVADILAAGFNELADMPKGERTVLPPDVGSTGEVLEPGELERG